MYHYNSSGLDNIYLNNGYVEKETPHGKAVSIHNLDGLHDAISKNLLGKTSPLTGKEFRFLRIELELSQNAIGSMFEKTDQTIAKWEKGEVQLPRLADVAMRNLYADTCDIGVGKDLLRKLQDLDRLFHEEDINIEETSEGWLIAEAA
ncbi:MAG: transcriptional regulator [Gammaproteobacteria bacterium]|nr:MAG: transcriptional regulator [Gammaproteobacteria bacterium]